MKSTIFRCTQWTQLSKSVCRFKEFVNFRSDLLKSNFCYNGKSGMTSGFVQSRCDRIIRIFTFLRQFLDCYFCILCAQLYCWALQNVRKVRSLLLSNFHVVRQFFVSHVPNICTQFQVFLDSWILYQICKIQESFFCYGKSDIMFKM